MYDEETSEEDFREYDERAGNIANTAQLSARRLIELRKEEKQLHDLISDYDDYEYYDYELH